MSSFREKGARLHAVAFLLFTLLIPSCVQSLPNIEQTEKRIPAPVNPFRPRFLDTGNKRFLIRSNFELENHGTDTWELTEIERAMNLSISLFMNSSWQTVTLLDHSHPLLDIVEDEDGNSYGVLDFQRYIQPGESIFYSVSYNVLSKTRVIPDLNENESGTIEDIPENLRERYCVSDLWLEDEDIREAASSVAGDETNVLVIIKKFVGWIWDNIEYPSDRHEYPYFPNETLKKKEGDCDDQAMLLITFCRIYGIPSFLQIGCIYVEAFNVNMTTWGSHVNIEYRQIGWHGWAMVYVPPWGWLPVDLTFIWESDNSPISAIKYGAVTSPKTIQCMNDSNMDDIGSSRELADFLQRNGFYLSIMEEMLVTLLEDVNCDFSVDMVDILTVASAFNSRLGDDNWNILVDLNNDEWVNIRDLYEVAKDYGKTV